ncbi:MAG: hypothetical protein Q9212_007378, partial [Teloschistes hypoglaucus]
MSASEQIHSHTLAYWTYTDTHAGLITAVRFILLYTYLAKLARTSKQVRCSQKANEYPVRPQPQRWEEALNPLMSKTEHRNETLADTFSANLEHCLWTNHLGFLIHKKVKLRDVPLGQLRIAEIGTVTGIWLIDAAKKIGPTVRLDGFGSDLSLAPPIDWLPMNVNLYQRCNFVSDIEENFHGFYDLVKVSNIANHVINNDPGDLMKKFLAML